MWMIAGLAVIVSGLVVVAWIANSGRISADTGNELTTTGFKTQKRNACITDLRNEADLRRGEVSAAVLNRLIILDARDPDTGKPLPKVEDENGKMVVDPDVQKALTDKSIELALAARADARAAALKLTQPTLNELCGDPITSKDDTN